MLRLLDGNTVMVVASSMGQKPFISDIEETRPIIQLRSLDRLMKILRAEGRAPAISTMCDQFNIYPEPGEARAFVINALKSAYRDSPDQRMFYVYTVEGGITV